MQVCRKNDTFRPQAWLGDDGARLVKNPSSAPKYAKAQHLVQETNAWPGRSEPRKRRSGWPT
ncbi:hypothetical protein EMIT0P43_170002 [Pseudomonas jessenii]